MFLSVKIKKLSQGRYRTTPRSAFTSLLKAILHFQKIFEDLFTDKGKEFVQNGQSRQSLGELGFESIQNSTENCLRVRIPHWAIM